MQVPRFAFFWEGVVRPDGRYSFDCAQLEVEMRTTWVIDLVDADNERVVVDCENGDVFACRVCASAEPACDWMATALSGWYVHWRFGQLCVHEAARVHTSTAEEVHQLVRVLIGGRWWRL